MKRFLLYFLAFLGLNIGSLQAQTDEPCGATALTVNASCSGLTGLDGAINPPAFTNSTTATAGVTLPSLSCNGFTTTTRDFWFTVVVPASGSVNKVSSRHCLYRDRLPDGLCLARAKRYECHKSLLRLATIGGC